MIDCSGYGAPKSPAMSSTSTAGQAAGTPEGAVGGAQFEETTSIMNDLPPQMFGEFFKTQAPVLDVSV